MKILRKRKGMPRSRMGDIIEDLGGTGGFGTKTKSVRPKKSTLKKQKVNKKAKKAIPKDYQGTGGTMRDFGSPNQYVIPKEIKLDVSKLKTKPLKPVKNKVKSNAAKVASAATAGATAAYAYEKYVGRNSQD